MTKVKVLIPGYTSGETNGHSCSTVTLVQDKNLNIIVDPGTLPNQKLLIKKLAKEDLKQKDINIVFITHSHMDHYRNIGMFPNAKALDYFGYWERDVWSECNGKITENIELIKTPGHSDDSVSLLVSTKKGLIAICGDVFWKKDEPQNDPFATNKKKLEKSRKTLFKIANFIIPGHGNIFKV